MRFPLYLPKGYLGATHAIPVNSAHFKFAESSTNFLHKYIINIQLLFSDRVVEVADIEEVPLAVGWG